jgi:RimJ/RimL family protein N-acetyltransferase
VKPIETARLRLVPVTADNAGLLWSVLQEPDLREYQDLPDLDRSQFLRIVGGRPTRLSPGSVGRFEWLIHYTVAESAPVGWVSLRIAESSRSAAEIGYSVVSDHRGCGIATEAVAALCEEGFRRARLREIRAYCVPENQSSRAVLRRNGFETEGTLRRGATVGGRPVDVIAHVLQRIRWESLISNRSAIRS